MPSKLSKVKSEKLTPTPRGGRGSDRSVGEVKSFVELAFEVAKNFVDIPETSLREITNDAFNADAFGDETGSPAPLIKLDDNLYVLKLWHGPTMAFKDFGARFMARAMSYYLANKELKIIVATSGDTGSAVAAGFYNVPGIKVYILYPSGKVSDLQEKQLTTFGGNITAIEVKGTFDDCQSLAKQVLSDKELNGHNEFSSANSINFGRLLPQMFYYFWAYTQLLNNSVTQLPAFSVPSGNFGNLTAGLMAKRIGLPASKFIAATNINDVVPEYLATGVYRPRPSQKTMSNSMDVGNPSNFARMLDMYQNDARLMKEDIMGIRVTEKETTETIKSVYNETGYLLDPHSAVAIKAASESGLIGPLVALSTAHPVKFKDSIEPIIGQPVPIPEKLKETMAKEKQAILIENDIEKLKRVL